MARKLDLEAVDEVRGRYGAGASVLDRAERSGVSERRVRRLVVGVERQPPAFEVSLDETVAAALDRYLSGLRLDDRGQVRAAPAVVLARNSIGPTHGQHPASQRVWST